MRKLTNRTLTMFLIFTTFFVSLSSTTASQATSSPVIPFLPYTLVDLGSNTGYGQPLILWQEVRGDWVVYATGFYACGHCGYLIDHLYARNTIDGRRRDIHAGIAHSISSDGPAIGAINLNLGSPYLVWQQPLPDLDGYKPGDLSCIFCYADLNSGQMGPIAGTSPVSDTINGLTAQLLNLDSGDSGDALFMIGTGAIGSPVSLLMINIKTGAQTPLPWSPPSQGYLPFAAASTTAFNGDYLAWSLSDEHGNSYDITLYQRSTGRISHLVRSHNVSHLRFDDSSLFWAEETGTHDNRLNVFGYDFIGSQTVEIIAPSLAGNFDVAGGRFGWIEQNTSSPAKFTLKIKDLTTGTLIINATLGEQAANTYLSYNLSLSADKLSLFTVSYPGNDVPDIQRLSLAWLLHPDPAFARTWASSDQGVLNGTVQHSWLWGPQPDYIAIEPYIQSTGGRRMVLYYDKSRMEVNNPSANAADPYYITNGLLSVELISGQIQTGDHTFIQASVPCTIPVAGDTRLYNPLTPGYAAMAHVASLHGENQSPDRSGQFVSEAIDVNGLVSPDQEHSRLAKYNQYLPQTGHNIPDVFTRYLNAMNRTYGFDWVYVMGYPITEGYWTQMIVGGKQLPVLVQAFQRRVLTYTPSNAPQWQVQQGNAGQHYLEWRYKINGSDLR